MGTAPCADRPTTPPTRDRTPSGGSRPKRNPRSEGGQGPHVLYFVGSSDRAADSPVSQGQAPRLASIHSLQQLLTTQDETCQLQKPWTISRQDDYHSGE